MEIQEEIITIIIKIIKINKSYDKIKSYKNIKWRDLDEKGFRK